MATDQQLGGVAESLIIDRATASRFGITPQTIDNTLYDAFGQRQINTLYTQLNQYHVILETDPKFQLESAEAARYLHSVVFDRHARPPPSASNTAGSSSGAGAGAAAVIGQCAADAVFDAAALSATPPRRPRRWPRQCEHDTSRCTQRQLELRAVAASTFSATATVLSSTSTGEHLLEREHLCRAGLRGRRHHRRGRRGRRRRQRASAATSSDARSAERVHPFPDAERGALDQSSGTVPGGDDLIQSGPGILARPGAGRDRQGHREGRICRPAWSPIIRARPRPSKARCRTRAC